MVPHIISAADVVGLSNYCKDIAAAAVMNLYHIMEGKLISILNIFSLYVSYAA